MNEQKNIEIVIERSLWRAENNMPAGQSWNLSSKAACKMLAKKIREDLIAEAKKDDSLYLALY
jgi:hypothetical protein